MGLAEYLAWQLLILESSLFGMLQLLFGVFASFPDDSSSMAHIEGIEST